MSTLNNYQLLAKEFIDIEERVNFYSKIGKEVRNLNNDQCITILNTKIKDFSISKTISSFIDKLNDRDRKDRIIVYWQSVKNYIELLPVLEFLESKGINLKISPVVTSSVLGNWLITSEPNYLRLYGLKTNMEYKGKKIETILYSLIPSVISNIEIDLLDGTGIQLHRDRLLNDILDLLKVGV